MSSKGQSMLRFFVGFGSAFVAPIVKIYSAGTIDFNEFNLGIFLGHCIPLVMMGLLVGVYAITVNQGEDNMKRLFMNCLALPALLVTMMSGNVSDAVIKSAHATEFQPSLVYCTPVSGFKLGMVQAISGLTGKYQETYYIVTEKYSNQDRYVKVKDKRYYIDYEVTGEAKAKKGSYLFDVRRCKLRK